MNKELYTNEQEISISPECSRELNEALDNDDTPELSDETLSFFVPQVLKTLADNPDNIEVVHIATQSKIVSFMILEHNSQRKLSDADIFNCWRQDSTSCQDGVKLRVPPNAPRGVDRLHEKYARKIDDGDLLLTDRVFLSCSFRISERSDKVLIVSQYDGEIGNGIAKQFYTETLPMLAKSVGARYIIGNNNVTNHSFFTNVLGRSRFAELNEEGFEEISPIAPLDPYGTVQFLCPEDKEKFTI